jgi:hypothetical protein
MISTERAECGMSGRSLRALAMDKHAGLAAACSAVVGSPAYRELLVAARRAAVRTGLERSAFSS